MPMARLLALAALWIWLCFPLACDSSSSFSAMFFLGASMLDVGTNYYVPNSTSRSVTPPYAPGRFSNGLIIPDFLEKLAGLPPIPPFLRPAANLSHGANFASSGSGLLDDTGKTVKVVPFFTQLAQFKHLTGQLRVKYDLPSSVVVINVGTNDLQAHVSDDGSLDFIRMLSNKLEDGLKEIYHLGVRKILVIGISPLGCTPMFRLRSSNRSACWKRLNSMVKVYNGMVQASLDELRGELLGLRLIYFDAFGFTKDMINNGAKYGFRVTDKNCCGEPATGISCGVKFVCKDPQSYLYWDYHPTERAHSFIAEAIWTALVSKSEMGVAEQTLMEVALRRQLMALIVSYLKDNNLAQAATAVANATMTPVDVEFSPNKLLELVQKGLAAENHSGGSRTFKSDAGAFLSLSTSSGSSSKRSTTKVFPRFESQSAGEHKNAVRCARFSSNGRYVATGGADTSVKLFEVEKVQQMLFGGSSSKPAVKTFYDHAHSPWWVSYSQ